MSSQAQMEIGFWRDLYRQLGHEGFLAQRREDGEEMVDNLPLLGEALRNPDLRILEVGSGLVSALSLVDGFSAELVSLDPLMEQYRQILDLDGGLPENCSYLNGSGEDMFTIVDESFDVVVCVNVIDHTPDPAAMLAEIKRVLKKGGTFYFEVNFDPALSPAHYGIWNQEITDKFFGDWKPDFWQTDYREEHNQTRYWARFTKSFL